MCQAAASPSERGGRGGGGRWPRGSAAGTGGGEAGSGDQTNPGAGTIASRHRRRQQRGPRPGAAAGRGGGTVAAGHPLPLGEGGGPAAAPHHCYLSSRTRERGREAGRERSARGRRPRSVRTPEALLTAAAALAWVGTRGRRPAVTNPGRQRRGACPSLEGRTVAGSGRLPRRALER